MKITKNKHIVLLNGIDITEYFTNSDAVHLRCMSKEERGYSHFRFIHRGLNERIEKLQKTVAIFGAILKDDPVEQKKTLAPMKTELKELKDRLKAIGK